jgi:uncharacterized protein YgbK (DUF1537 family)
MEALTLGGVQTVLLVEPPTADTLRRFPHARAVGIAGNSRTMSPDEMEAALPEAFAELAALHPKFVHYKVCSTFDSSPAIGSIGRAIDVGQRVFQNRFVPLVVGVPSLSRFCAFGTLFARSGLDSEIYRIDRHPTMRQHPVTPMTEADLRVHLSRQTARPVALIDAAVLDQGYDAAAAQLARTIRDNGDGCIVLFDTLNEAHLATIGRLLAESQQQERKPLFVAGSSGIEYALVKHLASELTQTITTRVSATAADRVIVASGSCSPVTDRQIAWATANGFAEIPLDTQQLFAGSDVAMEVAKNSERAAADLDAGRSIVLHTCRGPADPRKAAAPTVIGGEATARRLGVILGQIVGHLLDRCAVRRVGVTGGDTSGYVARTLGIEALEMIAPLEPGAPLCQAYRRGGGDRTLEITFKGGQVGHDDFFGTLLGGRPDRGA